jgi:hypothetical protein
MLVLQSEDGPPQGCAVWRGCLTLRLLKWGGHQTDQGVAGVSEVLMPPALAETPSDTSG